MFLHAQPMILRLFLVLIIAAAIIIALRLIFRGGARFKLKTPLLSVPEQDLYRRLVSALPDHIILAQVAFSQLIDVAGGDEKENFRKHLTARQKVADFVVCNKAFRVTAVVELDDSTHSRAKDQKRDAIVVEAGARTLRWRVKNLPSCEEIRAAILVS